MKFPIPIRLREKCDSNIIFHISQEVKTNPAVTKNTSLFRVDGISHDLCGRDMVLEKGEDKVSLACPFCEFKIHFPLKITSVGELESYLEKQFRCRKRKDES